jgi:hypothetical protein
MSYADVLVALRLFWQNVGMPIAIQAYCELCRYSGSCAVILAETQVCLWLNWHLCNIYKERYVGSLAISVCLQTKSVPLTVKVFSIRSTISRK